MNTYVTYEHICDIWTHVWHMNTYVTYEHTIKSGATTVVAAVTILFCHVPIGRVSHVQCVAVCCSVLQCVAVCCSVLQCVAVLKNPVLNMKYLTEVQPIASGVSFNHILQPQSNWSLFHGSWQKRRTELDNWSKLEFGERTLHMQKTVWHSTRHSLHVSRFLLQNIVSFIGLFCKRDL